MPCAGCRRVRLRGRLPLSGHSRLSGTWARQNVKVGLLMIAGNKFMTKQLVDEQTKLDAELVRTKERIAAEKEKRLQMSRDRSERVIGYLDTLGHV
jgi:hypothetical protein